VAALRPGPPSRATHGGGGIEALINSYTQTLIHACADTFARKRIRQIAYVFRHVCTGVLIAPAGCTYSMLRGYLFTFLHIIFEYTGTYM
jgi:hypothetical protein